MSEPLLTTTQVAQILGVSKATVLELIWAKSLVPTQTLRAGPSRFARYRFAREEVAAWLVRNGTDPRIVRSQLAPGQTLVLVRCEAALQTALRAAATRAVPSLFHLGRLVATEPCWGAVVDLPAVGVEEAQRAVYAYSKEHARPELVGLHGDELAADARQGLSEVFDVLLPKALGPDRLGRAILRLAPTRAGRVDSVPAGTA